MNGNLILPGTFGRQYRVFGGPYYDRPNGVVGVKLAKEINEKCDIDLKIEDFSVPVPVEARMALTYAAREILGGAPVYVGCMGGRGRTGLFLSLLAKAWGIPNPVEYVRKNYFAHAVETPAQYAYVENFDIPSDLKKIIRDGRWWNWSFKKELTSRASELVLLDKKLQRAII